MTSEVHVYKDQLRSLMKKRNRISLFTSLQLKVLNHQRESVKNEA